MPITVIFKMKAVNAAMLEHFASPWNCIYSAKDLAADPNAPKTKINGTGPFIFVEHVKGSHVSGKRNDNYFKKGLPYLDGFKGVFTLQAAAMLNALQGGQVLAEFRGISPAERDRLVQAMGDKIRIEESSWTLNLLVCFNVEKKPFDDVRVRKALLMAIDRWGGSQALSRISTLRSVGGVIRPGSPYATPEAELVKLPGFSKDITQSRAEAKQLLAEAGVPNLKFTLQNRNLAMPYTPAGIFLVDQWRQIGVKVEHKQSDTAPYLATMNAGNHDVAIDFSNLFMDDSSLGLAKYLSVDRAPENRSRSKDRELDKLYDDHLRERDPEKRKAHDPRVREAAVRAGLSAAAVVVAPHRADPQDGDGLEDVAEPQSRPGPGRGLAEPVRRCALPCSPQSGERVPRTEGPSRMRGSSSAERSPSPGSLRSRAPSPRYCGAREQSRRPTKETDAPLHPQPRCC